MGYFQKCYDVIGYGHSNGDIICYNCADEFEHKNWIPIFADSEWDYDPVCDRCDEPIEVFNARDRTIN